MQPSNTGGWPVWYGPDTPYYTQPQFTWTQPIITIMCPYCGNPISMDSKFCPHCGAQIWEDEEKDKMDVIIEKLDEIIELLRGDRSD